LPEKHTNVGKKKVSEVKLYDLCTT